MYLHTCMSEVEQLKKKKEKKSDTTTKCEASDTKVQFSSKVQQLSAQATPETASICVMYEVQIGDKNMR